MAEVQQTSDATFRLFDWNRRDAKGQSRQLHIEESLACIDWNSGPVQPIHAVDYGSRRRRSRLANAGVVPVFHAGLCASKRVVLVRRHREDADGNRAARRGETRDHRGQSRASARRHTAVSGVDAARSLRTTNDARSAACYTAERPRITRIMRFNFVFIRGALLFCCHANSLFHVIPDRRCKGAMRLFHRSCEQNTLAIFAARPPKLRNRKAAADALTADRRTGALLWILTSVTL